MKNPTADILILDAIDRRILAELHAVGGKTNVELARRAGIPLPALLRRSRRLEEAGVIRPYETHPTTQQLGWEITFFAVVGLDSQKESVLTAFEQFVASWPEVRECHMIRGGGDFLLKLVANDTAHENQLTQRLARSPSVSRVQTLQTIRTSRTLAGVPIADREQTSQAVHTNHGRHPDENVSTDEPIAVPFEVTQGSKTPPGSGADAMGAKLLSGLASATRAVGAAAHAKQLAIPGQIEGRAVEVTPDGRTQPIDQDKVWSPTDWVLTTGS